MHPVHVPQPWCSMFYLLCCRYNNKTYRVDDFDWDKRPDFSFKLRNDVSITLAEYYKKVNYCHQELLLDPLMFSKLLPRVNQGISQSSVILLNFVHVYNKKIDLLSAMCMLSKTEIHDSWVQTPGSQLSQSYIKDALYFRKFSSMDMKRSILDYKILRLVPELTWIKIGKSSSC